MSMILSYFYSVQKKAKQPRKDAFPCGAAVLIQITWLLSPSSTRRSLSHVPGAFD